MLELFIAMFIFAVLAMTGLFNPGKKYKMPRGVR